MLGNITAYAAAHWLAWTTNFADDDPSIDYNDGEVNTDVKTGTNNAVTTILYVIGGLLFVYSVFLIVKMAGGEKKLGGRLFLAIFGVLICVAPSGIYGSILGAVQNILGL